MADEKKEKVSFKSTLNLPKTDFSIRANAKENDPKILERWEKENISKATFSAHEGNEKYIMHDGPPYANGHIHLGHAYNKILKDFVCKAQRMMGKQVPVTPGWDCHGLPIELAVERENPGISTADLKKKCREYAQKWVDTQKDEFKKLGIFMDWENPYLTMNPEFEAKILQAFGEFVEKGYIERKNKTVPWCASCHTVLASAEIEYQDRKDPSIYVLFALDQETIDKKIPVLSGKKVDILVWTTTPWTLPLNRAVFLRPKTKYVVLENDGKYFVLAESLADVVCAQAKIEKNIVATINADDIVGGKALHPFVENLIVPVLADGFVGLDEGTACVHSAPGCGPEDYELGIKNNLEIYSPLSADGKYTESIQPAELEGMSVADGNCWAIKKLLEKGRLLHKMSIKHPFPHCWRCHKPLIFRATKQWFCNLSQGNLKGEALEAIEKMKFYPNNARNYLKAAVGSRLEWCLSRQRAWGVPITALICKSCDYAHVSKKFIDKIAAEIAKKGIEYWDNVSLEDVMPKDFACPKCNCKDFKKEHDILDVWFESGITHYAVLKDNPKLGYPSEIYIEALDQNRGWFQSSLLTSLVLEPEPSTKSIYCHGFTVDNKGRKMSKSIGNVVAPNDIIKKIGTDSLRLWVASIEQGKDLATSDQLFNNVAEVYRKIRNTSRFLLSNLYDFDHEKDSVKVNDLFEVDQYALLRLAEINEIILEGYENADFTKAFHTFASYCTGDLSSFYLDIVKDRLYVEQADGARRRSTQTVCWYILDTLTRLTAPILSFTAEQISDFYQKDKSKSIHLQEFASLDWVWRELKECRSGIRIGKNPYEAGGMNAIDDVKTHSFIQEKMAKWDTIKVLRSALLKTIEQKRAKGEIKHSLEVSLEVYISSDCKHKEQLDSLFKDLECNGQPKEDFLKELMIVSQFKLVDSDKDLEETELSGVFAKAEKMSGVKCPRCWQWEDTKHKDGLCKRCEKVVG